MEEDLHLLRQQALRTLRSPSRRAGNPSLSLARHRQTSFQQEPGFRIEELLFHKNLSQLHQKEQLTAHKFVCDKTLSQPECDRDSSLLWRKRSLPARPPTHSKRQKRSTSDTSSHSAYSSSSQSHSSRSSYSSHSSSLNRSHRSRSSSYSSQSRSLSSHHSGSYSRSSFSSSSHSPPSEIKSRSKNPRHQHIKTRGIIDKQISSSAKNTQSSVIHKSSRTDTKYQQRDGLLYRDRTSLHSSKIVEHIYRPRSRHSRSPPRLRDKFLEHNRRSGHSHDFHYRHRPPCSSSREKRTIGHLRRSPPVDSRYSRGRMRPSHSAFKLRRRTLYPPSSMQRRRPIHSHDRSRELVDRNRTNRLSSIEYECERKLKTAELCHRDKSHNPNKTEIVNTNNMKPTRTSDADLNKNNREERERRETTKRAANDLCKSDEYNSVRKYEDLARKDLEQSETQFEASDLLGEYEFSVELDYDENMEELDVHCIESPKTDGQSNTSNNASVQQKVQSSNPQSSSRSPDSFKCDSLSIERSKKEEKINSPICVSPHRDKSSRNREDDKTPFDGKLSVKERLYVSRHTIEEKRKAAAKCESQSVLRPSLASRLGPSPRNRHGSDDYLRSRQSRMLSKSSKGDAVAIAEAYRRKKRRETIGLHEDEVQKAKKFTEIINEHGSKNKHPESPVLADVEDDGEREKALDKRINEIKEQNKAIMKRNREIEQDREMYG